MMMDFVDVHIEEVSGESKVVMDLDMRRFEKQFTRAQYKLDSTVMTGMIPFMPMITGTFINVTKAMSAAIAGTGYVYAAAPPYGRFLYYGKTMVSPETGSTFASYGEKKVLVSQYKGKTNAKENLTYNKTAHPEARAEWYEEARKRYLKDWVNMTKATAGGG